MMMGDDSNPTTTENVEYDHSYQLYPHSWLETFQLYLPHRILAAVSSSSSPYKIDYNVLSVAAMTLALIMMVEYVRHRLDHWAHVAATTDTPQQSKQPIFRAVLEGVYAECKCIWSACSFFWIYHTHAWIGTHGTRTSSHCSFRSHHFRVDSGNFGYGGIYVALN